MFKQNLKDAQQTTHSTKTYKAKKFRGHITIDMLMNEPKYFNSHNDFEILYLSENILHQFMLHM